MRLVICLFYLLLPCPAWAGDLFDPGGKSSIDFLYINANAGEAAGGHTALRLGDTVFHYQFFPDGSFLLVRDSWDSFRLLYNDLHNRSISIATLPLPESTYLSIRNHFTELLARQQQFFDRLDQARSEKETLEGLLDDRSQIVVNGLGFFIRPAEEVNGSTLRTHIAETLGEEFLMKSLQAAEQTLQQIIQEMNSDGELGGRLLEALSFREALRVLSMDSQLDRRALIPAMAWEEALSPEEREQLQKVGRYLTASIIGLLQSRRLDRGEVLLLQTARYLAVHESLATSKIVTLDPFFADVRTVELQDEDMAGGKLELLQADLLKQAKRRRELFLEENEHHDISCALFETSRARAWEMSRVSAEHRRVRILVRPVLPAQPAAVHLDTLRPDRDRLQRAVKQLEAMISTLLEEGKERYAYNLISQNCATELIGSLNASFPDSTVGKNALGGWLEADDGLLFIPFLFYSQLSSEFSITEERLLPARRLRNLERMYLEEDDFLVWLRESNSLTSTLYEPRIKDTPFLFFTDDSFLLRPLLGIVNVSYAMVHGAASLFTIPFDGGERLKQAGRGIFYSLPELTFGSIRKGSYPFGDDLAHP